jgi:hypothetical protein
VITIRGEVAPVATLPALDPPGAEEPGEVDPLPVVPVADLPGTVVPGMVTPPEELPLCPVADTLGRRVAVLLGVDVAAGVRRTRASPSLPVDTVVAIAPASNPTAPALSKKARRLIASEDISRSFHKRVLPRLNQALQAFFTLLRGKIRDKIERPLFVTRDGRDMRTRHARCVSSIRQL